MDTIPKLKFLVFLLFIIPTSAFSQSAPTGYIDLAGWVKGADGTYSKAFEGANRSAPLASSLKVVADTGVQTSKGFFSIPIEKTANVDVSRVGKAVRGLAVLSGPVGMTVAAASLVCELTNICNQAGSWLTTQVETLPNPDTDLWFCSHASSMQGTINQCKANYYACNSPNRLCSGDAVVEGGYGYKFKMSQKSDGFINGYADMYRNTKWVPSSTGTPTPTTDTDWDNATSKLNDQRFVPELIDKQADVPTDLPTITNAPKAIISQDTSVTKDANGNVTGTKVTSTEAEIVDAATAESPGKAIVKETTTVTNYDINNTVINSTTSTSYTSQPPPPDKPVDSITISFDDVPDDAIEHEDVDAELETPESWGDGFCPADETIDYHYGTLTFDFQPTCDFAIGVRPVLIFMASITALFIVAGVKVE